MNPFKKRQTATTKTSDIEDKYAPTFPDYCRVCGSGLQWVMEPDGYWEDTGEERIKMWLKCPNWPGGQTKFIPGAFITYTALELNRNRTDFVKRFGYTRYQTCNDTIIY